MIERKNIDRVFQENFKDLEIEPGKKVWDNIEVALNESHYKKTISLWQRLSGVAMILVLFLTGGIWYTNSNAERSSINRITNTDDNNFNTDNVIPINRNVDKTEERLVQINQKIKKVAEKIKAPIFVKNPNNDVIVTTTDISSVYKNIENKYIIDKNDFIDALKSDQHIITQIEPKKEIIKEVSNSKKWSVGTTVSPIYYNSLQNGSPINEILSNNKTTTDDAFSYGVKINYQLTKKINLQSGVNKVEMAYNTKGVNAFISTDKNALSNTHTTKPGVILSPVVGGRTGNLSDANSVSKSGTTGDINQSLEYFELPIEMKYNLYSKKLGFNLVGGFSTYLLTKNTVSLISQNQITDLGGANNLNSINFSGNVGFDLDYKISKSWYFNVTPMFKYQFNTYSNNSGNFKPYYLGVYSGLNFKF
ncbi:MAG: outer membrane beta-barrel protein [Flavobacteriaceae bacterium]|nr:outer membrane beta-barrel protein [Flavobacteriaceae bacterium]